ncbi:MAG: lactate utilization protein [Candidatus Magasanikbacteria bacterium]|nr:lactate utilization protein [Candidatus Magasanikbacteria bacterium]
MSYTELASKETIDKTIVALKARNVEALFVETKEEAFKKVKELIPLGASVHNGSSRTLEEIGMIEYLKGTEHGWNNLHSAVVAESDPEKQVELRQKALHSDFYLGSLHALSETGEMVIASASGSQLPHLVFTSKNIILVVGVQKITSSLETAIQRLREYVYPLEDERMKSVGMGGSVLSKMLILEREPEFMGRSFKVILVNEKLGF